MNKAIIAVFFYAGVSLLGAGASAKDTERAQGLDKLRALAAKDAGSAAAQLAFGMAALDSGNYFEAERALGAAAALDPASVPAHFGLAMLHEKKKQNDQASNAWQKVLDLTKDQDVRDIAQRHLDRLAP